MSATFKLDGHEYVAFNGGSGYRMNGRLCPRFFPNLVGDPDREKAGRAFRAMKRKKLDIAALKRAQVGVS